MVNDEGRRRRSGFTARLAVRGLGQRGERAEEGHAAQPLSQKMIGAIKGEGQSLSLEPLLRSPYVW